MGHAAVGTRYGSYEPQRRGLSIKPYIIMLYETKTLKLRLGAKRNSMRYDAKSKTLHAPDLISVNDDLPKKAMYMSRDEFVKRHADSGSVEFAHKTLLAVEWAHKHFHELLPVRISPDQRLAIKYDNLVRKYVHPFGSLNVYSGGHLLRLDALYVERERFYIIYEFDKQQMYVCVEDVAEEGGAQ